MPRSRGPGSSVGIATDYGLDGPGSNPFGDEIFRPSRPALGPTQLPVQWVPGLSLGRGGQSVGLTPPHLVCQGPRKSRAIPLLTLRAFVDCEKGATYMPCSHMWVVEVSLYLGRGSLCISTYVRDWGLQFCHYMYLSVFSVEEKLLTGSGDGTHPHLALGLKKE
jgi:hypothetical protein